ncbi:G-type lectin S-receptor-like serine/threonine-protein kinase LECRK3 [Linum grandiflorum]
MTSSSLLILLSFIWFPILNPHFSTANVTLSSSLTAGQNSNSVWDSPSGDFAFGFSQLKTNSDLFLLAVWFNKIPSRTIVWFANGDNPVLKGSKVELSSSSLALTDPGGQLVWEVRPGTGTISYAALLDTGNFVLVSNTTSEFLWQSFSNPTDTLLPNQTLNLGTTLFAKRTETNYTKGRFALRFSNGSLDLVPVAWPGGSFYNRYYTSGTYSSNPSEAGNRLVFNASAQVYVVKGNGDIAQLLTWDFVTYRQDSYYRVTLGFDGLFTQYSHPKNFNAADNPSWLPVQTVPDNLCTAFFHMLGGGPCGYNSYCAYQDSNPTCSCPPGYVIADSEDSLAGCIPTYPQGCGLGDDDSKDSKELYEFRKVSGVDFPLNDYERLQLDSESVCEDSCLNDCACAVAIFDGLRCWKKRLPLSNGRTWNSTLIRLMFKVRKGDVPSSSSSSSSGKRKHTPVALKASLGSSIALNGVLVLFASLFMLRIKKRKVEIFTRDFHVVETSMRSFSYKEVEAATDGFKVELGRGSFGIVYKGILKPGNAAIAVKKLDKLAQEREKEFKTEVNAIGRTHHKNLVRLYGYCDESSHRVLIYEFMSNGSLSNFLFTLPRPEWHHRVSIAMGIARGLVYLHEECPVPIIHCDIKPHNILLDDSLTARISDFGLAKLLLSPDQTRTKTMIRGTRGYVAPEWFKNVAITAKVDVYSFGVMLLEIICCRKSVEMELEEGGVEEEKVILTEWAYECLSSGRIDVLVGKQDVAAMEDKGRLQRWVLIAMWCVQEDPSVRPTMKKVMEMMEGYVDVPLLPLLSTSDSLALGYSFQGNSN